MQKVITIHLCVVLSCLPRRILINRCRTIKPPLTTAHKYISALTAVKCALWEVYDFLRAETNKFKTKPSLSIAIETNVSIQLTQRGRGFKDSAANGKNHKPPTMLVVNHFHLYISEGRRSTDRDRFIQNRNFDIQQQNVINMGTRTQKQRVPSSMQESQRPQNPETVEDSPQVLRNLDLLDLEKNPNVAQDVERRTFKRQPEDKYGVQDINDRQIERFRQGELEDVKSQNPHFTRAVDKKQNSNDSNRKWLPVGDGENFRNNNMPNNNQIVADGANYIAANINHHVVHNDNTVFGNYRDFVAENKNHHIPEFPVSDNQTPAQNDVMDNNIPVKSPQDIDHRVDSEQDIAQPNDRIHGNLAQDNQNHRLSEQPVMDNAAFSQQRQERQRQQQAASVQPASSNNIPEFTVVTALFDLGKASECKK